MFGSIIVEFVGEILTDMLDTLKAFMCWLLNWVADRFVDVVVMVIDWLPDNAIDPVFTQEVADHVYALNELLPIVEFSGMFATYLSWRLTWGAFKLVVWVIPGVGGGM